MRIRSSTWLHLIHGLILVPSGISGKMTVTLDITTMFAMLDCLDAIAMSRYLPLVYQASQIAMVASNLFTLPSKPLFGYVTALLSPSYSVVSCSEVEDCSMMDMIMLGYHNISYLINASIYLVKGGRLGLMPGVLFHSCCPSFRHSGVMFLDFAFLTRLGDLWDPLDSSL